MPDLIFSLWVLGRKEPLELFSPPGTKAMVDHIEAAWREDIGVRTSGLERGNKTGYRVQVHEIKQGVIYREGPLKVTAFPMLHGAWAHPFGYRVHRTDPSLSPAVAR